MCFPSLLLFPPSSVWGHPSTQQLKLFLPVQGSLLFQGFWGGGTSTLGPQLSVALHSGIH